MTVFGHAIKAVRIAAITPGGIAADRFRELIRKMIEDYKPAPPSPVVVNPSDPLGVLRDVARRAKADVERANPRLSRVPFLRGILIHKRFAEYVRKLGPEFSSEVSYKNRRVVPYGTDGSVRADAIFGPKGRPVFAFELKTGGAYLTSQESRAYFANLPVGTRLFVMREINLE